MPNEKRYKNSIDYFFQKKAMEIYHLGISLNYSFQALKINHAIHVVHVQDLGVYENTFYCQFCGFIDG